MAKKTVGSELVKAFGDAQMQKKKKPFEDKPEGEQQLADTSVAPDPQMQAQMDGEDQTETATEPAEETTDPTGQADMQDAQASPVSLAVDALTNELVTSGEITEDQRAVVQHLVSGVLDGMLTALLANLPNTPMATPAPAKPAVPPTPPPAPAKAIDLDAWNAGPLSGKSVFMPEQLPTELCIKALGKNRVGSYLCLWGDENHKDLSGEWFSPKTAEMTDIFKAVGGIPALYHHALDGVFKSMPVGVIDVMTPDDVGMWVEAQVKQHKEYAKFIAPLVEQRMLGWSSGTLPVAREVNKATGEILRWPFIEGSMTPAPMEWRMKAQWPVENIKSIYQAAGLRPFPTSNQANVEAERLALLALEL